MTLARAIEFRRPLIRVTNTGVTTASLASGELLIKSPNDVEWADVFDIRYQTNPAHTFYEKLDALWGWILLAATVLVLAFGRGIELDSGRGKQLK
jgi:apolipoprotein N-acyltransferase